MLRLRKFPVAKNSMDNKGGIKIFRRSSFVSLCRKLSQENPSVLCLRKIPVAKNSMDKEREVSRVSVGNLFSYSTEKFSGSEYFYG